MLAPRKLAHSDYTTQRPEAQMASAASSNSSTSSTTADGRYPLPLSSRAVAVASRRQPAAAVMCKMAATCLRASPKRAARLQRRSRSSRRRTRRNTIAIRLSSASCLAGAASSVAGSGPVMLELQAQARFADGCGSQELRNGRRASWPPPAGKRHTR